MSEEFASFLLVGSKQSERETIFAQFSNGVKTNRDSWAWNFSSSSLASNIRRTQVSVGTRKKINKVRKTLEK
jgi:predicted helicase